MTVCSSTSSVVVLVQTHFFLNLGTFFFLSPTWGQPSATPTASEDGVVQAVKVTTDSRLGRTPSSDFSGATVRFCTPYQVECSSDSSCRVGGCSDWGIDRRRLASVGVQSSAALLSCGIPMSWCIACAVCITVDLLRRINCGF